MVQKEEGMDLPTDQTASEKTTSGITYNGRKQMQTSNRVGDPASDLEVKGY